jgi:peroxiredoxin
MTLTPSNMPDLGLPTPDFALPDIDGRIVQRDDFAQAPALLVVFWCNHCPYVKHLQIAFAAFAKEFQAQGLAIVAINSNDAKSHPDDSPAEMKKAATKFGYSFAYLFDESQEVAKAYAAACTPDFFLYDANRKLVYRGQYDDSRPGSRRSVTGADLRQAVTAVLNNQPVSASQIPSIGCNIKWRSGNEPAVVLK